MNLLLSNIINTEESFLFFPWSATRTSENETEISGQIKTSADFQETFLSERANLGAGKIFEYDNNLYSTYYKDEWDCLKTEQKQDFLNQLHELETNEFNSYPLPVATNISEDMAPEDAFYVAREEIGKGGIFFIQGEAYTTYTQEELYQLSPAESENFCNSMKEMHIEVPVKEIGDIHMLDLTYEDTTTEDTYWSYKLVDEFEDNDIMVIPSENHDSHDIIVQHYEDHHNSDYPDHSHSHDNDHFTTNTHDDQGDNFDSSHSHFDANI